LSPRVQVVHIAQHDVPIRVSGHQVRVLLQYTMANRINISWLALGIEETREKQSCPSAKQPTLLSTWSSSGNMEVWRRREVGLGICPLGLKRKN
jgi:hypothetical protein